MTPFTATSAWFCSSVALCLIGCAGPSHPSAAHARPTASQALAAPVSAPKSAGVEKSMDQCTGYDGSKEARAAACLVAADGYTRSGDAVHAADAVEHGCVFDSADACARTGTVFADGIGRPKNPKAARSYLVRACDLGNQDACAKVSGTETSAPERAYRLFTAQLNELETAAPSTLKGAALPDDALGPRFACTKPLVGFEAVARVYAGNVIIEAHAKRGESQPAFQRVLEMESGVTKMLGGTRGDTDTDPKLRSYLSTVKRGGVAAKKVFVFTRGDLVVFLFQNEGSDYSIGLSRPLK